jgi:hypothetical protein
MCWLAGTLQICVQVQYPEVAQPPWAANNSSQQQRRWYVTPEALLIEKSIRSRIILTLP